MFKQVLKNKSTFIGIALFLCVLFGASLWYQSFMRKEGMTDSDTVSEEPANKLAEEPANKLAEEPADKKNKISDTVIPFAENSSVGPSMAGEPINIESFTEKYGRERTQPIKEPIKEPMTGTVTVQTYNF